MVTRKAREVAPPENDEGLLVGAAATDAAAERVAAILRAGDAFAAFKPARKVLRRVLAVPTRFVQLDHATRVGGLPVERFMLVHGPSNEGKAQPIDEPVLTPRGWTEIGRLNVGDEVIGRDGLPTKVLGVYPQGRRPVYRVTLDDGSSTRCCEEHLWVTTSIRELNRGRYTRSPRPERSRVRTGAEGSGSVKSLREIRASLAEGHYVPAHGVVHFAQEPLPLLLDPHYLGCLLGDGGLSTGSVNYTSGDWDLIERLEQAAHELGDTVTIGNVREGCVTVCVVSGRGTGHGQPGGSVTRQSLEQLGLMGCRSEDKFVPAEYLLASPESRLELLRGLMDTDGHLNHGTNAQFCTTSTRLRDAVVHLVRSLGGSATTWCKETDHLPAWLVGISFQDGTNPFWLPRKADQWRTDRKRVVRRRISAVEPCGEAECVCIRVASEDHLYLTKDFVPTHNTVLSLGLIDSFLERGHYALYIDAERTTPITWCEQLMGARADHPAFFAMRPESYEQTIADVRQFLNTLAEQKAAGHLPPQTSALVVCDSLRKLVPADLMKEILEAEAADADEVKAGRDRRAQIQAKMNAAWMDELVPLLERSQAGFLAIAREMQDPEAGMWDRRYGNDYKVGGGIAVYYDSSLVLRVEREGWVTEGEGQDRKTYGERLRVTIKKTKVGGKDDRVVRCRFHTSNGVLLPEGFDRARDVVELAADFGVVEVSGASHSFMGKRFATGRHNAVRQLHAEPELLAEVEATVRRSFAHHEPEPDVDESQFYTEARHE